MSTPSLTLHSWECPASVSLSAPLRPSFRAGSGARGAHTCRVCSVGPVSALQAGRGDPGKPAAGGSRSTPRAARSGHLCTTSHRGAPFCKGVTRAPKAPVRGLLDSGIWPRALSGSEMGTMANSSAPQAPRAPGPAPLPSPGSSRSALRADSPHCHHRLPASHGHDGTAPAAGGTSLPTCSRPRAWPVAGPREMFAGSRGTSGARKDAPLRAEVPPASL